MPAADKYMEGRYMDPAKPKPKVPGLATTRFNPTTIFAGRPEGESTSSAFPSIGGLAGANTQTMDNPFSSVFLFKQRR